MTTSRLRPLIAGNWKMNGSRAQTEALIQDLKGRLASKPDVAADLLVCPPAPYVAQAAAVTPRSHRRNQTHRNWLLRLNMKPPSVG